jgi:hypothetical protein
LLSEKSSASTELPAQGKPSQKDALQALHLQPVENQPCSTCNASFFLKEYVCMYIYREIELLTLQKCFGNIKEVLHRYKP